MLHHANARRLLIRRLLLVLLTLLAVTGCGKARETEQESTTSAPPSQSTSPAGDYEAVEVKDGGTIDGVVLLEGPPPPPVKIRVARPSDQTVCGTEKTSHTLRVGPGGAVRDVVVYLEGIHRGRPLSSLTPPPPVDQKECQYDPHVAIYPSGVPLELASSDPLLHNVHAYLKGGETLFNAAMPRRGMKLTKPLPPGGFVRLQCDVHSWMNATVWISPHPYVASTDESGRFALSDVPPGNYTLKAWHPTLGEAVQEVEVRTGTTASVTLRMARRP